MKAGFVLFALLLNSLPVVAVNSPITQYTVPFDTNAHSQMVSYRKAFQGYEIHDYLFSAQKGEKLRAVLISDNQHNHFNLLPKGSLRTLFTGSIAGQKMAYTFTKSGEYIVRVYLTRQAAKRDERADYLLILNR